MAGAALCQVLYPLPNLILSILVRIAMAAPSEGRAAASVAGERGGAGERARYRWKALDMLSLLAEFRT